MNDSDKYAPTEEELVEQYADMLVALNGVEPKSCRAMVRETFRRAKYIAWDEGFEKCATWWEIHHWQHSEVSQDNPYREQPS